MLTPLACNCHDFMTNVNGCHVIFFHQLNHKGLFTRTFFVTLLLNVIPALRFSPPPPLTPNITVFCPFICALRGIFAPYAVAVVLACASQYPSVIVSTSVVFLLRCVPRASPARTSTRPGRASVPSQARLVRSSHCYALRSAISRCIGIFSRFTDCASSTYALRTHFIARAGQCHVISDR